MITLAQHEFHQWLGATFAEVNGAEVVADYGDWLAEHSALTTKAAVLDLGFRSRLCVLGGDRQKFLHGQVTNNVNALQVGQGCYAALVNARGRIQSDLHIYRLHDELLLDFEPGLTATVTARLEGHIIADDVQLVDVASHYGLLSVQGPLSKEVIARLQLPVGLPAGLMTLVHIPDATLGDLYLMNLPRTGTAGFDFFVPLSSLGDVLDKLVAATHAAGGCPAGWRALEAARIEAGIPRFGQDMDESNLAPETGITDRAISYNKGCYIGQEVIARIRTYGQVTRSLRGLRLADDLPALPARGAKLTKDGREAGHLTSIVHSPRRNANLALGYVRKECNSVGETLDLDSPGGLTKAVIVDLPFIG
jgi:folate-binding protein YgfZ